MLTSFPGLRLGCLPSNSIACNSPELAIAVRIFATRASSVAYMLAADWGLR